MTKQEALDVLGVSWSTLRRMVDRGQIRTSTYEMRGKRGKRNYWEEDVLAMVGRKVQKGHDIVAYIRVNGSFKEDKLKLQEQRDRVKQFASARGISIDKLYEDIGPSTDFSEARRPAFNQMFRDVLQGNIDAIIIDHKDRFCRIGYEVLEINFKHFGTDVVVINKTIPDAYYQQEQSDDLARLMNMAKIDRVGSSE